MNNKKVIAILAAFPLLLSCLWDYDTLEMERQRFPSALELITGKFLRHSPEFYYWRIKDRERRIQASPDSLSLYDDLAVAYSKLGQEQKALEIMRSQLSKDPNRYETLANIGTFLLHLGKIEEGIQYIKKAIEINPNAHFGREKYQLLLAEYILEKKVDGEVMLPLCPYPEEQDMIEVVIDETEDEKKARLRKYNFYGFLKEKGILNLASREQTHESLQLATKGTLGMMRFGKYNSPILLEALGDLASASSRYYNANQIAARAYLHASYQVDSLSAKLYREKAAIACKMQYDREGGRKINIPEIEQYFLAELEEGKAFYQEIVSNEHLWIYTGQNLDSAYSEEYYSQTPKVEAKTQQGAGGDPLFERSRSRLSQASYTNWLQIQAALQDKPDPKLLSIIDSYTQPGKVPASGEKTNKGNKNSDPFFIVYLLIGTTMALLLILKMRRYRMNRLG